MTRPQILNSMGERLDTLVEGKLDSDTTVIFVHGFATSKHETNRYFDDIAFGLKDNFRIVRFDFSGCGESEGNLTEMDYDKQAKDLGKIISYVKEKWPGRIYLIAQSMGTFVTAHLNPQGIEKAVFTGIPNSNVEYIIERLIERFGSRPGASIDFEGISILPRSSGMLQKIGPSFWRVLRLFQPAASVTKFSQNTKLLIIHPKQDDIVGAEYLSQYAKIPNVTVKWLNGDHNFKNIEDRKKLIEEIKSFFT